MPVLHPEHHEISTAAYYRWLRGGQLDGHDLDDWYQGRQLVFIEKNYERLAAYPLRGERKIYLGRRDSRVCRYCGAVKPPNRGWKVAHALPELAGNKILIAMDECSACNEVFHRLEDDFGKMLHLGRTMMRVGGKEGVPSFKTRDRKSRIDAQGARIDVRQGEGEPFATYDPEKGILELKGESQPFVPIAAYKCLVKMALAIMPPEFLPDYRQTISWLRNPDHGYRVADVAGSAQCWYQCQPGPVSPEHGWCMLLGRRSSDAELPHMMFVLMVANTSYQIMVPFSPANNHLAGRPVELPAYPSCYGFGSRFGEPLQGVLDLSSAAKQRFKASGSYVLFPIPGEMVSPATGSSA